MTNPVETPDQEPQDNLPAKIVASEPTKGRRGRQSLASARRELSEKELASPAVIKLLLDDIDRLEDENTALSDYRSKYHDTDRKLAVLEQKNKQSKAHEVIAVACQIVGAAALGYVPAAWSTQPTGAICLIFGVLLVGGGLVAKAVKS